MATLHFCSWNIQIGMKRERLLEIVRTHPDFRRLDLLALQEASTHRDMHDAQRIAAVLGPHYLHYQYVYHFLGPHAQANALVWNSERVRMDSIEHHTLPQQDEVALARAERVLLKRLRRQPRVNLVADGEWNHLPLRVCSAHLDVVGFRFKRVQFRAILDNLRARPAVPLTILAGDLNTFGLGGVPNWESLKRDAAALGLRAISDEIPYTQSMGVLPLRQKLDEIFAASTLPMHAHVWTLQVDGSDHLPVFADITIRPDAPT